MRKRQIDVPLLKLMLKHHRLIHFARQRGYSELAIVKLVVAAEDSKSVKMAVIQ